MLIQVDAVYENGVLRPLQLLDLREHACNRERRQSRGGAQVHLAVEYIETGRRTSSGPGGGP